MKFREGKMIDAFKIKDPDIKSIPLDCGVSGWRASATQAEKDVYPLPYNKHTSKYNPYQRTWDDGYDDYYDYKPKQQQKLPEGKPKGGSPKLITDDDYAQILLDGRTLLSQEFDPIPEIIQALQNRVETNAEEVEVQETPIEVNSENNGFNDLCVINLKVVNRLKKGVDNLYVCLENEPILDGFTWEDGEVVIPIPRSSGLINGQVVTLQLQSIYTEHVFRVNVEVSFRKNLYTEINIHMNTADIDLEDRRTRHLIEDLPNEEPVKDSLAEPEMKVSKKYYQEFIKDYPDLIGVQKVPYWEQLGFSRFMDYESAFTNWINKKGVSLPSYKGVRTEVRDGNPHYRYGADVMERWDVSFHNVAWHRIGDYERKYRIDFAESRLKHQLDGLLDELKDDVELYKSIATLDPVDLTAAEAAEADNMNVVIAELKEGLKAVLELCDTISMDYDNAYGIRYERKALELEGQIKQIEQYFGVI